MTIIDIVGQTFGRWSVIGYAGHGKWDCECKCGTKKAVDGGSLRSGRTNGCLACKPSGQNRTHGESKTRLYKVWEAMKRRCLSPKDSAYPRYGGRGITVSSQWLDSYETFAEWAKSSGYNDDLTIDRIDNDKGYSPENCRWIPLAEQNRNYSKNRFIDFRGRKVLAVDLEEEFGISQGVISSRVFRYGWSVERAISTPVAKRASRRAK